MFEFYYVWVMLFCSAFYGMFMAAAFKNYGSTAGKIDDVTLSWAASIGALCNGISRIVWALSMEHWGFKRVFGTLLCI